MSMFLQDTIHLYTRRGMTVRIIMMDMEFVNIKEQEGMELVDIKSTAAREHVGKIEQAIGHLK